MCGIVGYIGNKSTIDILLNGLKELEYRGYDSAGVALVNSDDIEVFKAVGKIANLEEKINQHSKFSVSNTLPSVGIGHTRWATHGKPTEVNAHPHMGEYSYVVHNGIIENYKELKDELVSQGHVFLSQTDTEVIVHLFEHYNNKLQNPTESFRQTINRLEGAFAILLITKSAPDQIFFFKQGSPLIVAKGLQKHEVLFASSDAPLIGLSEKVIYLEDGTGGVSNGENIEFFTPSPSWSSLPLSK